MAGSSRERAESGSTLQLRWERIQKGGRKRVATSPDIAESSEPSQRATSALRSTRCFHVPTFVMESGEGFSTEAVLEQEDLASALFGVAADARPSSLVEKGAGCEGRMDIRHSGFSV